MYLQFCTTSDKYSFSKTPQLSKHFSENLEGYTTESVLFLFLKHVRVKLTVRTLYFSRVAQNWLFREYLGFQWYFQCPRPSRGGRTPLSTFPAFFWTYKTVRLHLWLIFKLISQFSVCEYRRRGTPYQTLRSVGQDCSSRQALCSGQPG